MRRLAAYSLLILLSGCGIDSEEIPVITKSKITIGDLTGKFNNIPDKKPYTQATLSSFIMGPSKIELRADGKYYLNPDRIISTFVAPHSLRVAAYSEQYKVKEKLFEEGRDFVIDGDRVTITDGLTNAPFNGTGSWAEGISHRRVVLQVDTKGNIVINEKMNSVGLLLFAVPMAFSDSSYYVYKRIGK
jgi:hypothetical protein